MTCDPDFGSLPYLEEGFETLHEADSHGEVERPKVCAKVFIVEGLCLHKVDVALVLGTASGPEVHELFSQTNGIIRQGCSLLCR